MPAITKDEAIKVQRAALQNISETRFGWDGDCGVVRIADDALAATEHITDTAATQAAGMACSVCYGTGRGVDGKRCPFDCAPVTTAPAAAPIEAVEVPPLPEGDMGYYATSTNGGAKQWKYSANKMTNFYREGYAAGRASMKGNKP